MTEPATVSRFLRLPEVCDRIGLSRSTVYRLINEGVFPDPVKVTARTSAWLESSVQRWMAERIQCTVQAASMRQALSVTG
jgi:prophage regulatory protein